jgi:hypothetical protein
VATSNDLAKSSSSSSLNPDLDDLTVSNECESDWLIKSQRSASATVLSNDRSCKGQWALREECSLPWMVGTHLLLLRPSASAPPPLLARRSKK